MSKRILVLALVLSLMTTPAWAARGFGATDGTGASDIITTGLTTEHALVSYSMWIWLTGDGGGSLGRMFDKGSTVTTEGRFLLYSPAASGFRFFAGFSGTIGDWSIATPSTGAWHHLGLTYNGSSTVNNPIMYLDGSSVTVTRLVAPVGTIGASTQPYIIGNRADGLRHWNGRLAEFAVWPGTILSAGDMTALYNSGNGARADSLATQPTAYWKLCGTASPEPNDVVGSSGTVTGTAQQAHPFVNCNAASGGSSNAGACIVLGIRC